ncbi:hypothetical protein [Breznakiella homolactica]|uniref:Uncharacterized protein n=1 Tax=Breznakiella homolactica TaxID=2798577 RepID=A0A7T8B8H2_9SPIR|nr:hypothetical protein [Breznakiella homolactica]QQO08599.1 hypothetical protein JFL75_16950 [Breznakiella homolactica]
MNESCASPVRLIVLIPHRDTRILLRGYKEGFFRRGFHGVYSFPLVSPLAAVREPLPFSVLKETAQALRVRINGGDPQGKIHSGPWASLDIPGLPVLSGPSLDLPLREFSCPEMVSPCSPSILGFLFYREKPGTYPGIPDFSFRAAALANMAVIPLGSGSGDFSFAWEIGRLQWLPPGGRR